MTAEPVGSDPRRVGGEARVTGRYEYVGDVRLANMQHAKLVSLDVARAKILNIDVSAASRVPGVSFVLTGADLPNPMPRFGPQYRDRPVLGVEETKFHGEPVAAVVATSEEAAEIAAQLVVVDYHELPAIFTISSALESDAPLVQDPALRTGPLARTNLLTEHRYGWGDVDGARAEVVVEGTYTFPMVTQFAIEPHTCIAAPDGDGVAIWTAIQHPFVLQRVMAELLEMPLAKVRVFSPDPGGSFGGKQHAKYEPLVAFLALRLGHPVRLVLTLEQTFQTARRSAAEIRVRTGFKRDGTITFCDIDANYLLGAYADIADRVVSKGAFIACGPYRVPAARIIGRGVLSHTPPATAFRGFGTPQQIWAMESNMEAAARKLGIGSLDLRLKNLVAPGETFIHGDLAADGDWAQTVHRAAELIDWGSPLRPNHGRGLALGVKAGITASLSYATVRLLADGSAILYSGTSDMGQGARTVLAQIVSAELGVPLERISVVMGDTGVVPYDQQTSASRSTVDMGAAVLDACHHVQKKLRTMTAHLCGVDKHAVKVVRGKVHLPSGPVGIPEIVGQALGPLGGEVIGNGESRHDVSPDHPLGGEVSFYEFNATAVEVEVDLETGQVTVVHHVTVSDVGKAINPLQVRGQDEGGAIQGLGHTLMEHYLFDDAGRILNLGAIDYRIPTSLDVPGSLVSDHVENSDGPGPYGAKGMSEGALLPVAPAVGAAVTAATGVVIRDLPITAERVWWALKNHVSTPRNATQGSSRIREVQL